MLVPVFCRQVYCRFSLYIFRVETDLFRQEKEEYVNMTADCCHVQVRIVLLVFLCYVGTILSYEKFDCVVSAVLYCER